MIIANSNKNIQKFNLNRDSKSNTPNVQSQTSEMGFTQNVSASTYRANFIPFCSAHVSKIIDAHGHIMDENRTFNDQGIDRHLTLGIIKSATTADEGQPPVKYVSVSNLDGLLSENQREGKPRMDFIKANEIMLDKCQKENEKSPEDGLKFLPQAVCDPLCDNVERFEAFILLKITMIKLVVLNSILLIQGDLLQI